MSRQVEFTWGDVSLQPKEFISRFGEKLPLLVKILEGYSDASDEYSYSTGDVYWVTHILQTCKIIFRRETGHHLSMPADYSLMFHLIDDDGEEGEAQSLASLAAKLEKGDVIVAENDGQVNFGSGIEQQVISKQLGKLTYVAEYCERGLVGNMVEYANHLHKTSVVIPAYVDIPLVLAEGLVRGTDEDFQAVLQGMHSVSQKFHNERVSIKTEIMLYEGSIKKLKTRDYDYMKPSDYMKCKQIRKHVQYDSLKKQASVDSEESSCDTVMTASKIYEKHVPVLPPRPQRSLSTPTTPGARKLPAPPPKWSCSTSLSTAFQLDAADIDDEDHLYEKAEPLDEATPAKSGTLRKSLSISVENIMKFFKNKEKKKPVPMAVVKPQVKPVVEDDGYVAVARPPPVRKPPKLKKHKKKKDKTKHRPKKDLPPLPIESDDDEDYEITEFPPPTSHVTDRQDFRELRKPVPVPQNISTSSEKSPYIDMKQCSQRTRLPPRSQDTPGASVKTSLHSLYSQTKEPKPKFDLRNRRPAEVERDAKNMLSTTRGEYVSVTTNSQVDQYVTPLTDTSEDTSDDSDSDVTQSSLTDLAQVPKNLDSLSMTDVSQCLRLLNLEQYVDNFANQQVDGALLSVLTVNILVEEFKMVHSDSLKLRDFVRGLRSGLN